MQLVIKNSLVKVEQPALLHIESLMTFDTVKCDGFHESYKRQKSSYTFFETEDGNYVFHTKTKDSSTTVMAAHITDFMCPLTLFKSQLFLDFAKITGIAETAQNLVVQEDPKKPLLKMVTEDDVRIFSDMKTEFSFRTHNNFKLKRAYILKGEEKVAVVTNIGSEDSTQYTTHYRNLSDLSDVELNQTGSRKTNEEITKKVLERLGIVLKEPEVKEVFSEVRDVLLSLKHLNYPPQIFKTTPRPGYEVQVVVRGEAFLEKESEDIKVVWFKLPDAVGITALVLYKNGETFADHKALQFLQITPSKHKTTIFNLNNTHAVVVDSFNEITQKNGIKDIYTYIGLIKDEPISGKPKELFGMKVYGDLKLTIKINAQKSIELFEQYGDLFAISIDKNHGTIDFFNLKNIGPIVNNLSVSGDPLAQTAIELLQKHKYLPGN